MFVLRTGLQGNGKTLTTIKEVDAKAHAEGRVVYYCNITGFKPDHPAIKATWLPFDFPERWFDLPSNSIIVIDEAQTWFRVRPQGSKVPDFATRLEIMRKDGHELHCITQSPKLIDSHMRQLCNMHIHYSRGNGGPIIKRWVFQNPELTVNDNKLEFANGESSRITIDKSFFGCYESVKDGSAHHFKFRPPKALIVLGVCLVVIAALSYRFYTNRIAPSTAQIDAPGAQFPQPLEQSGQASFVGSGTAPLTTEQYIESRIPRVPDLPSSAPMYDQITQPVSYPKTFCVSSKDQQLIERASSKMTLGYKDGRLQGCRCNTQQGSKVEISFDVCMATVENGFFDPAKPDAGTNQQAVGSTGAHEERGATVEPAAPKSTPVNFTVVNSGKPGLLW